MHTANRVAVKLNRKNVYLTVRNTMSRDLELKHGHDPGKVKRRKRRLHRLYDDQKVIVISKGLKDDVVNEFGCRNADVSVIYNGFDFKDIDIEKVEAGFLEVPDGLIDQ